MEHVNDFLSYLKNEKRYSVHTCRSYELDLRQFQDYISRSFFPEIIQCEPRMIRSWLASLMETGMGARSVTRKMTTLRSFYKFLLREGRISKNPMRQISPPKVAKKLPVFVEEPQMQDLFDNVDFGEDFEGIRNKLIISLFYHTGIRLAELVGLSDKDIRYSEKTIRVLGKRNKERVIPASGKLFDEITHYIKVRDTITAQPDRFFTTIKGKPVYAKLVYRIVQKYLEMVTTLSKKSPHIIRHTFATHMLNRGADLNAIKELLGHANLAATQVYTHTSFEKLKKVYNSAHPRS